ASFGVQSKTLYPSLGLLKEMNNVSAGVNLYEKVIIKIELPQMNLASTLKGLDNDTNYLDHNDETLVRLQDKVQSKLKSKILKFDFFYEESTGAKPRTSTLFNVPQKNQSNRVPVTEEKEAPFM